MSHQCFKVDIADKIAHVILNRPEKRNAMSPEFWVELPRIIREIDDQAKARVIVISSTGPHFSAGLDAASLPTTTFCICRNRSTVWRSAACRYW